jgi:hypothetical protein
MMTPTFRCDTYYYYEYPQGVEILKHDIAMIPRSVNKQGRVIELLKLHSS